MSTWTMWQIVDRATQDPSMTSKHGSGEDNGNMNVALSLSPFDGTVDEGGSNT